MNDLALLGPNQQLITGRQVEVNFNDGINDYGVFTLPYQILNSSVEEAGEGFEQYQGMLREVWLSGIIIPNTYRMYIAIAVVPTFTQGFGHSAGPINYLETHITPHLTGAFRKPWIRSDMGRLSMSGHPDFDTCSGLLNIWNLTPSEYQRFTATEV